MTRYDEAEALWGHPLQYAFVQHVGYPHNPMLVNTENMTDEQVCAALSSRGKDDHDRELLPHERQQLGRPQVNGLRTERYNRCPTCEQWSPCDVRKREQARASST